MSPVGHALADGNRRLGRLALGLGVLLLAAGCNLRELKWQAETAESIGRVTGRIVLATGKTGAVHVIGFQQGASETEFVFVSDVLADPDGSYRITTQPGTFFFGAYQDLNGDGVHQRAVEPASYFNKDGLLPTPFTVGAGARLELEPLTVATPLKGVPEVRTVDRSLAVTKNIGRVVGLDDPMFSRDNAGLGLWRPVDFLLHVGGGLFMLQAYERGPTPIIFVHGINGSPNDLAPLIRTLDRDRFQPWVLHYPSGLRLEVVSDYLDRALDMLHTRHGFDSVYVVAHSMGGLVARSFLMRHEQRGHPAPVAFLMTINSPMRGMASAAKGVEFSPVVVPSWRDVAPDSEFIRQLGEWQLPARIPYHLVFAWQPGNSDDGVVALDSQLPIGLQDQAARIYGFSGSHAGLLSDPEFLRHFEAALAAQPPRLATR